MRLSIYLKSNKISMAEFGRRLGRSRSAVLRYCDLSQTPDLQIMIKIKELTGGSVGTFEDWIQDRSQEGKECQAS